MEAYRTNGYNASATARMLKVQRTALQGWVRRNGYACEDKRFWIDGPMLRDLYIDQRLSPKSIAARFNVTEAAVSFNVNKYGLRAERSAIDQDLRTSGSIGQTPHDGYVNVHAAKHPRASSGGSVPYHCIVVEKHIGRHLQKGEIVHHINLVKDDNRIENLALLKSLSDHSKVHSYYQRVAVWMMGLTAIRPVPLVFREVTLWAGRWVESIDLSVTEWSMLEEVA